MGFLNVGEQCTEADEISQRSDGERATGTHLKDVVTRR